MSNTRLRIALSFLDIGWRISLPLVLLVVIGNFLDNRFGTKPLFVVTGIFLSLGTTGWTIYRLYKRMSEEKN